MMIINDKTYLDVDEVAALLKCSKTTVYRLHKDHGVKIVKVAGRLYIPETEVHNLFEAMQ